MRFEPYLLKISRIKTMLKLWCLTLLLSISFNSLARDASYVLIDIDNSIEISSSNEEIQRPIGSITKLMTALVILKSDLNLDETLTVTGSQSSRTGLRNSMKVSRKNLLKFAIISSDNLAAETLARTYPGGLSEFVDRMNQTAYELGMYNTEFEDPIGIGAGNLSTLHDIVILTQESARFEIIQISSQTVRDNLIVIAGKIIKHLAASTTNYFSTVLNLQAAKTGFTSRAGRCLTMVFNQGNRRYGIIILGAKSPSDRNNIVYHLLSKIQNLD